MDEASAVVQLPIEAVPPLVWAVFSAVAALLMAVVPPSKMPKWLASLLNLIGSNWGQATNANDPVVIGK